MSRLKYKYVILVIAFVAIIIMLALKLHTIMNSPEKGSEHIGYSF